MFNQQPHQALGIEDELVPGGVLVPVEGGRPREMSRGPAAPRRRHTGLRRKAGAASSLWEPGRSRGAESLATGVSGLAEDRGCSPERTTWPRNAFSSPGRGT